MQLAIAVTGLTAQQLEDYLPSLAESGATALEVGWNLFDELNDRQLEALARRLHGLGLRVRSVHGPFGDAADLSSLEKHERLKSVAAHEMLLKRMPILGATHLVIHPGNFERKEELLPQKEERVRRSLAALVGTAMRAGMVLALENMLPSHPGSHPERLLALVREHSCAGLGICFDTGHAHVLKSELATLAQLSPFLVSVHLSDNDTWTDAHLQPPYGTVDWLSLLPALARTGYTQPLTIETAPWGGAQPSLMVAEVKALLNSSLAAAGLPAEPWPRLASFDGQSAWLRCHRCHHFVLETEQGQACGCGERL